MAKLNEGRVVIVTGAGVRLTGSGLGCPDWPNCSPGRLAPHTASDTSAMIEFVNRAFTGLVSIAVILAMLGSLLRNPRRRDLTFLSLGLVLGIIGQIVLGGSQGTVTMAVNAATTGALAPGQYVYELDITSAGGIVTRLVEGPFIVDGKV